MTVTDATEHFGIEVTSEATIVISGELDLATSRQLTSSFEAVVDGRAGDVVVDLSGVTFLDSTALTVLITLRQQLDALGRRLVLDRPSAVVVRVLTISGLLEAFAVSPSEA